MPTCLNILLVCSAVMPAGVYGEAKEVAGWGEKKQVVDKLDKILQEVMSDGSRRPAILGVHIMELRDYVETPGRKYTVIALFSPPATSWDSNLYQFAYNEFYTMATSHALAPPDPSAEEIYFVVVDVGELNEEADSLPPDAMAGPAIVMFKRNCRASEPEYLEYAKGGLEAEAMARWVYTQTDVRIKIVRSQKYERLLYLAGLSVILARMLAGLGLRWETIVARRTLAAAAAGFCCLMTAGDMWNRIRRSTFFFDVTDASSQLMVDTYVVAIMYGAVVTGMILMIEARGGVARTRDPSARQLRCGTSLPPNTDMRLLSGLGLVCVSFSAMISFYRSRVQQYPFHFLFP